MNEIQESESKKIAGKILGWTITVIVVLIIYGLNQTSNSTDEAVQTPSTEQKINPLQTPNSTASPSPSYQTYSGYKCSDDCSGHNAGYEYAQDNDYTQADVDDYSGNSQSFYEGMQTWVDEQCEDDEYYCE